MVPETLEPSLQLASAVLSQLNMPQDEVAHAIQAFRRSHVSELQVTLLSAVDFVPQRSSVVCCAFAVAGLLEHEELDVSMKSTFLCIDSLL